MAAKIYALRQQSHPTERLLFQGYGSNLGGNRESGFMYDDSVLPTDTAVLLGLIFNIIAPLAAFWAAGKFRRWRLVFHGIAFTVVLSSPLMAMVISLPRLLPDEEEIPGARFVFLPLIVEAIIILLLYCLAGGMLLSKSAHSAVASWRGGDRYL